MHHIALNIDIHPRNANMYFRREGHLSIEWNIVEGVQSQSTENLHKITHQNIQLYVLVVLKTIKLGTYFNL